MKDYEKLRRYIQDVRMANRELIRLREMGLERLIEALEILGLNYQISLGNTLTNYLYKKVGNDTIQVRYSELDNLKGYLVYVIDNTDDSIVIDYGPINNLQELKGSLNIIENILENKRIKAS